MGALHKSTVLILSILILYTLMITSVFAGITVVPQGECSPENQMFETYRELNSHTAEYNDTHYTYVFCYSDSTTTDIRKDLLVFPDAPTLRECWAENIILKSTGTRNAHVALPHSGFANDSDYTTDLCFGYLQCSGLESTATTNGSIIHDQEVAKLTSASNAHISTIESGDTVFDTSVYCWEPICDVYTYAKQTPFPNLYTFDEDKMHFELANIEDGFSIVLPGEPLSAEAAVVTLEEVTNMDFTLTPIRIQDWSGYAQFEFFVYYEVEQNFTDVQFTLSGDSTHTFDLWRYVTSTLSPNTWLKVRVPIQEIGIETVDSISFKLQEYDTIALFLVDSMTFIPRDETNNQFDAQYCQRSSDGKVYSWLDDADDDAVTCERINGFNDTGSGCCGDDSNEYFAGNISGCFDSNIILNNTVFNRTQSSNYNSSQLCVGADCPGTSRTINGSDFIAGHQFAFLDETFYSCGPQESITNTTSRGISIAGSTLFQSASYTTAPKDGDACLTVGDYFCSPEGYFSSRVDDVEGPDVLIAGTDIPAPYDTERGQISSASLRDTLKQDHNDTSAFTCCPTNYCNYGGRCYEDMSNNWDNPGITVSKVGGGTEILRCVKGNWSEGTIKFNPDGSEKGYCAADSECFISEAGVKIGNNTKTCLSSTENYYDNYCHEGEWTSRTAVLAKTIVSLAEDENIGEYTLFCDSYEKTLNYLGEVNGKTVASRLAGNGNSGTPGSPSICGGSDCSNNFCVLNPKAISNPVYFGTSLNLNLTNQTYGIGAVFNLTCTAAAVNDFIECEKINAAEEDGTWYYHPKTKMIIFKKDNANIVLRFIDAIGDAFDKMYGLFPFANKADLDLPVEFAQAKLFNRIYVSNIGGVEVTGFTEEIYDEVLQKEIDALYIKYSGRQQLKICELVDGIKETYVKEQGDNFDIDSIDCSYETVSPGRVYTVTSTSEELEDIWVELTAKLRVS